MCGCISNVDEVRSYVLLHVLRAVSVILVENIANMLHTYCAQGNCVMPAI